MKIESILSKQKQLYENHENDNETLLLSSFIIKNLKNHLDSDTVSIAKKSLHNLFCDELSEISFITISNISKTFPEEITGKEIARIIKKLSEIEQKEGGPYKNKDGKTETELNIIIANLLLSQETRISNLDDFIEENIKNDQIKTSLIIDSLLTYFLSEIYEGNEKEKLIKKILEKKGKNILDQIIDILSLLNLGYDEDLYDQILQIDNRINELDNNFVFIKNIKTTPELNFSFYYKMISEYENIKKLKKEKVDEVSMTGKILKRAEKILENLSTEFSEISLDQIKKTINRNKDKQMSLISYYVAKSINSNIPEEKIIDLGLMNTFFWTAFIIYDDFWDEDEEANPKILPSANAFARKYISYFSLIFNEKKHIEFFDMIMNNLDMANSWEVGHCRAIIKNSKFIIPESIPNYEDYSYKFYPSSGHILGPVFIMLESGYDIESEAIKNLIAYFKNYLIAMQINDDAHDWEEDMRRGHISTVVAMILDTWKEKYPNEKVIDLENDIEKIQELFWFNVLPMSAKKVLEFTEKSRSALHKLDFVDYKYLEYYVDINEKIALKALLEQKRSIEMLEEF